jgi:hypothetical protein
MGIETDNAGTLDLDHQSTKAKIAIVNMARKKARLKLSH